jgi:hypothetical protein
MEMRTCPGCKETKPLSEFYWNKLGWYTRCKACSGIKGKYTWWRGEPTKKCSTCHCEKELKDFPTHSYTKSGCRSECKTCAAKKGLIYKSQHQVESVAAARKRKYGITKTDFDKLLIIADNKCQICGTYFDAKVVPHIDHSHETGAVRGILCRACNSGIGFLQDNPILVARALSYLRPTSSK